MGYIGEKIQLILVKAGKRFRHRLTDRQYLTLTHLFFHGSLIRWRNPQTFNEKLQWLKLYNRRKEYSRVVDKIELKKWASEKLGPGYVIPILQRWQRPSDINLDMLPERFVIKCNRTSGDNYIHHGGAKPKTGPVVKQMIVKFEEQPYRRTGEWPYKNVVPEIFAEEYMESDVQGVLCDYKIYCFNGVPTYIQVQAPIKEASGAKYQAFYDAQWNRKEFFHGYPDGTQQEFLKPTNLDRMLEIAAKIASDFVFVRVDLYNVRGEIRLGELTLYPYAGFERFRPDNKVDEELGKQLKIK